MERLNHAFKVIAFDWDGTAVTSRQQDATPVRDRLEALLKLGVYVVIITGTSFQNVDRQVSAAITGPHKRRLFVCTNRGSEVYGFNATSRPVLIYRRIATAGEKKQLSMVAERVRREVERRGVDVDIVYNRLNRRKIDVIPLPEWRDPLKETIGELLRAVECRLKSAGIAGGLKEVIELTEQFAEEEGLADARVTSDVKHVEVGLTDKGDSVDWVVREIVGKQGLSLSDVLVAGDEFGPIDDFPGSDYKMATPTAIAGALFVSVGKEPNGVPSKVIHVAGGPARFLELLDQQIASHQQLKPAVAPVPALAAHASTDLRSNGVRRRRAAAGDEWLLIEEGFNLAREHEIESIFSIGNGYLGTRASLGERTTISRPATFIAGVFDLPPGWSAGRDLVKAPDWTVLRVLVAGEELRLDQGEMLEHRRILDLKHGMLRREWRHRDAVGRVTRLTYFRLASLANRHALAESMTVVPENYGATIAVESAVDGSVSGPGSSIRVVDGPHRRPVLTLEVSGSRAQIAMATFAILEPREDRAIHTIDRAGQALVHRWEWPARLGEAYHIDKLVSVYTSRDDADPVRAAGNLLAKLESQGIDAVRQAHERAWAERWHRSDLEISGDRDDQRGSRFAAYHLISAANPEDGRVSIGARALTGEAYKGHVFWDAEIFVLPFFTFTDPAAARALLSYRHHTLPATRERARQMGFRGALYAWESTTTGEDVTPRQVITPEGRIVRILCGEMEHHISADVAYAVWQYWQATADDRFLLRAGAEILLETARFWASRARREADGRYHIRHVIGPDEYHEDVDDNAYTNLMAQWNVEQGLAVAALLQKRWPDHWRRQQEELKLEPAELEAWREVVEHFYTGFDSATGLFEQFAGYFDLEYVDLKAFEPRNTPMDVILGRAHTQRTQVHKQADVVMLLYLLWDRFPPEVREANFRFYEPRCDHGSSLSPAIHSAVAARLGDTALARRYFRQTVDIDLANNMGNAASGVHIAALGALWQAAAHGFAGFHMRGDHPAFEPQLPAAWQALSFQLQWRNRHLRFKCNGEQRQVEVALERGEAMPVAFDESPPQWITPDKPIRVKRVHRRHEEVA